MAEHYGRIGRDRGHLGHHARAVAGDQHVSSQPVGLFGDKLAQASRSPFLAGFEHQFQVEAQGAVAFGEDRFEGGEVQRMLTFVVGGTSAVPAVTFLCQRPRE
jgi:hypothetical protein